MTPPGNEQCYLINYFHKLEKSVRKIDEVLTLINTYENPNEECFIT